MKPEYRLALRAIKTAIAVFLCLLLAFIFNRTDNLFACIASIICLKPTYNKGMELFIGTLTGGAVRYPFLLAVYKRLTLVSWIFAA